MKRAAAIVLVLGGVLPACSGDPPAADFSGRWLFSDTDPECEHPYTRCWVQIDQRDDRATLRAWGEGDDWTCDGRGTIEGNRLRFRWAGRQKNWRGWAEFELREGEIRATHRRDAVSSEIQRCRGRRHSGETRSR